MRLANSYRPISAARPIPFGYESLFWHTFQHTQPHSERETITHRKDPAVTWLPPSDQTPAAPKVKGRRPKARPMSYFTMGAVSLTLLFGAAFLFGGMAVMFAAKTGSGVDADLDWVQLQLGSVLMTGGFVVLCTAVLASVIGSRK